MPKYTVHFKVSGGVSVTVESDADPDDYDRVIDEAYEQLPGDLCFQCSGWRQEWSRELANGDEEAVAGRRRQQDAVGGPCLTGAEPADAGRRSP